LDATRLTQEAAAVASLSDRLEAAVGNLVELQGRMRETCVVSVSPSSDAVAAGGDTQALMAAVQAATRHTRRFEDIVADKRQAVARLRTDVQRAVGAGPRNEREALMSRVRTEVTAFESDPELRHLVQEQDSLRKSQALARQALEEGQRAHNRMQTQREMFDRIGSTALAIAEQAPVVKQVLGRIDSKRRREAVVLAGVAGFLLFVTFLLW
jgi:Golgi SNAP receptor complex protein 1